MFVCFCFFCFSLPTISSNSPFPLAVTSTSFTFSLFVNKINHYYTHKYKYLELGFTTLNNVCLIIINRLTNNLIITKNPTRKKFKMRFNRIAPKSKDLTALVSYFVFRIFFSFSFLIISFHINYNINIFLFGFFPSQ